MTEQQAKRLEEIAGELSDIAGVIKDVPTNAGMKLPHDAQLYTGARLLDHLADEVEAIGMEGQK